MSDTKLWAADPHEYGPGKVHMVDSDDAAKTFCGRLLQAIAGSYSPNGRATCLTCLDAAAKRPLREAQRQQYEEQYEERRREREQWHVWYQEYLRSPEWREIRAKVMQRAQGRCEGCGERVAREVHHTTYDHAGNEFLWELRAVCTECHERVTELDKQKACPVSG